MTSNDVTGSPAPYTGLPGEVMFSTFLGDFDAEYLLGKRGMFRVKAYNHTNNEIYRTSNNTQGIGFSFVRESKKLNQLFKLKSEFVGFGKDGMKMRSPCDSIPFRRKEEKDE